MDYQQQKNELQNILSTAEDNIWTKTLSARKTRDEYIKSEFFKLHTKEFDADDIRIQLDKLVDHMAQIMHDRRWIKTLTEWYDKRFKKIEKNIQWVEELIMWYTVEKLEDAQQDIMNAMHGSKVYIKDIIKAENKNMYTKIYNQINKPKKKHTFLERLTYLFTNKI